jgi:hypothetical protein
VIALVVRFNSAEKTAKLREKASTAAITRPGAPQSVITTYVTVVSKRN